MCYRTSNVAALNTLKERYRATFSDPGSYKPYFHLAAFSHPYLNILTAESPGEFRPYTWGLIPPWEKSMDTATKRMLNCANARGEEIAEKPSYRDAWRKSQRCIIPVTGIFESHTLEKPVGKAESIPYFIKLKSEPIFSLGGLYNDWIDRSTGEIHRTFTILTVEANTLMKRIHNTKGRMPLILLQQNESTWLNKDNDLQYINGMISPFDTNEMTAFPVSKDVHNPRLDANTENSIAQVVYQGLEGIIP